MFKFKFSSFSNFLWHRKKDTFGPAVCNPCNTCWDAIKETRSIFFLKKKQVREEGIGIESGTFSLQRMGAEPKNYCRQGFESETGYALQEIF